MKKILIILCIFAMIFGAVACAKDKGNAATDGKMESAESAKNEENIAENQETQVAENGKELSVALLLNGTLGDRSFFDSAKAGMEMIEEKLDNVKTKVVEATYDDTKWEPALLDLIDEGHDIIICGTWQMQEIVSRVAPDYPDQKFIVYDTSMDYSDGAFPNVYSIEYKQNDGSFLAGVLGASLSESGQIGFVGGMDNTVIYDFLVGYIQGAQAANPEIKVLSSFVGNFSDTAKAKELASSQFNLGADVIFSCASTAGDGTMQAGAELDKYVIGVDSDQAMLYKDKDPKLAELIPSSMLKRVDISLFQAIEAAQKGELAWGTRVAVGIPEDCVGLADNEIYEKVVPQETRDLIEEYKTKIKNGEITVKSAFDMENDELLEFVDSVK